MFGRINERDFMYVCACVYIRVYVCKLTMGK